MRIDTAFPPSLTFDVSRACTACAPPQNLSVVVLWKSPQQEMPGMNATMSRLRLRFSRERQDCLLSSVSGRLQRL